MMSKEFQINGLHLILVLENSSVLGSPLFLIFVDDLHLATKYSEVHHFAGNATLQKIP